MNKSPSVIAALFFSLVCTAASLQEPEAHREISSKASLETEDALVSNISQRIKSQKRPLKIAVVDTGLDRNDPRFSDVLCKMGHRNFADGSNNTYDTHGHGTHVAGLIKKHAGNSGYCLVILKYYDEKANGSKNLDNSIQAFKWAAQIGIDIVNFSGGGPSASAKEREAIGSAYNTIFVVAAGNESENIMNPSARYYPASYQLSNIFIVGNLGRWGFRSPSSNYGDPRMIWEVGERLKSTMPCVTKGTGLHYNCEGEMTGTSQATAVHTGKLIERILRR